MNARPDFLVLWVLSTVTFIPVEITDHSFIDNPANGIYRYRFIAMGEILKCLIQLSNSN